MRKINKPAIVALALVAGVLAPAFVGEVTANAAGATSAIAALEKLAVKGKAPKTRLEPW